MPKIQFLMLMRNEWLAALRQPFRRSRANVLTIRQDGADRRARATSKPPRAAPPSKRFFATNFRRSSRGRRKFCPAAATAFPTSPARSSRSSISTASRAIENMVGAPRSSAALPRQSLCQRLAGLARIRLARARRSRSATPGSRWSSGSSAARPSTSIPETAARDLDIPPTLIAPSRPHRLRRLCRGDRRRHDRRRRSRSRTRTSRC